MNESPKELILELISWRSDLCSMGCWALSRDDKFLGILCKLAGVDSKSELIGYFFEVLRADYSLLSTLWEKSSK